MHFSKINVYETKKFKNVTLLYTINIPFSDKKAASRSILPYIIKKTAEDSIHFEELYGFTLEHLIFKSNKLHILGFQITIPDKRFIKEDLFDIAISFINDIVSKSFIKEKLRVKNLESAKKELKNDIEETYDHSLIKALLIMNNSMYLDTSYNHPVLGTYSQIENLNVHDVKEAYNELINTSCFNLHIVGNVNKKEILKKYSQSTNEVHPNYHLYSKKAIRNSIKIIKEYSPIHEDILILGYQTFPSDSKDLIKNSLLDMILGKGSSSRLFKILRDINKKAYYIDTKIDNDRGGLFIISIIDSKDYQKISELIQREVNNLKEGNISSHNLKIAKKIMTNKILESEDIPMSIIDRYVQQSKNGLIAKSEQQIEIINDLTVEDLIKQVRRWQLNTIYFSGDVNDEDYQIPRV